MKKSLEMKAKLRELNQKAQEALDKKDAEGARALIQEAKELKEMIDLQETIEEEDRFFAENSGTSRPAGEEKAPSARAESAGFIRAALKKMSGKKLSEAENALLLPSTTYENGENGESYILPQDIRTRIHELVRQYKSLRDVVGYYPTGALTGSFPVEGFETVSELVDFADGTDGTDSDDISFKPVSFSLKEKAAFIKMSNTLLKLTDNALVEYVAKIFARKAVITENKMILDAAKKSKTVKALTGIDDLKAAINVTLDPAALPNTVIVTNQDGFHFLDNQKDANERPLLQPDPTNATRKLLFGYPVYVYSNTLLASTPPSASAAGKAPVLIGDLADGVYAVDLEGQIAFKTSEEAGFYSNTTVARLIEFFDAIQVDSSDKCYIYGELEYAPKTGAGA